MAAQDWGGQGLMAKRNMGDGKVSILIEVAVTLGVDICQSPSNEH